MSDIDLNDFIPPKTIQPFEAELSYGQLRMLHYLAPICEKEIHLPNYLMPYINDAYSLVSLGYLGEADAAVFLKRITVPELKAFLQEHGQSVAGKKDVLIQRVISYISAEEIAAHFQMNKYYTVTPEGQAMMEQYPREVVYDAEMRKILIPIQRRMNKSILEENRDFAMADIKFLGKYKQYDLPVKALVLAYNQVATAWDFTSNRQRDKMTDMFSLLYDVSVPNNVFYQVKRYLHAMTELKKLPKDTSFLTYTYTIQTMGDQRTCTHCQYMQGKMFNLRDAQIGVNYPPFYDCKSDFCRCFVRIGFDTKAVIK